MRSAFPEEADVSVGTQFVTQTPEGQPFPVWITKIVGRDVYISAEHPLVDYTPPSYINLLFTDLGILTPSAVSDELLKLYL